MRGKELSKDLLNRNVSFKDILIPDKVQMTKNYNHYKKNVGQVWENVKQINKDGYKMAKMSGECFFRFDKFTGFKALI